MHTRKNALVCGRGGSSSTSCGAETNGIPAGSRASTTLLSAPSQSTTWSTLIPTRLIDHGLMGFLLVSYCLAVPKAIVTFGKVLSVIRDVVLLMLAVMGLCCFPTCPAMARAAVHQRTPRGRGDGGEGPAPRRGVRPACGRAAGVVVVPERGARVMPRRRGGQAGGCFV
jgi:hypothetical protein